MRTPTEIIMQKYFEKHGYVRLRVMFQVKGIGPGGYQGLRGEAITVKLSSPSVLWTTVGKVKRITKEIEDA